MDSLSPKLDASMMSTRFVTARVLALVVFELLQGVMCSLSTAAQQKVIKEQSHTALRTSSILVTAAAAKAFQISMIVRA